MIDPDEPIQLDEFRRRRTGRARQSSPMDLSARRPSDASPLGLAIASVVDQRRWQDWAWLDQDKALHQP